VTSINIPGSVTYIDTLAFSNCTNVEKIICKSDVPPRCGLDVFRKISRTDCTLYVPETSGSSYKDTAPWREFSNIVFTLGDSTYTSAISKLTAFATHTPANRTRMGNTAK